MHEAARAHLKKARHEAGLTLKELASRIGVSTSQLSQIERGSSEPSVASLYALTSALGISLDAVLSAGGPASNDGEARDGPVVRNGTRARLEMTDGVLWEQLTRGQDPFVDALLVTYSPGGKSASDGSLMTHAGREYAYLIEGELTLHFRFQKIAMRAGDSLAFDSSNPHMYSNEGVIPARAIFHVVGRVDTDLTEATDGHTPQTAVEAMRMLASKGRTDA